jgi:hypothetical protein
MITGVSLALTSTGDPRIAYSCSDANVPFDLRYAAKSGGVWSSQIAAAGSGGSADGPSIVLDNLGQPRISFYRTNNSVRLAYLNFCFGCVWTLSTIETGLSYTNVGFTSLAIEPNNALHVAYNEYSSGDRLKYSYSTGAGAAWSSPACMVEDLALTVGQYPSIALGSDGRRAISHYTFNNNYEGRIAEGAAGSACAWTRGPFDDNTAQGSTSLDLDSQNQPVVTYWDACPGSVTRKCVRLAKRVGATWTLQTAFDAAADPLSNFVPYLSMDVDADDNPHIAFHGPEAKSLRYTRAVRIGDLDGDGCVDFNDRDLLVTLLLDPTSATAAQRAAADCNGDGAINGRDIQCLIDLIG